MFLAIFITYTLFSALLAGWLYGADNNEFWFFFAFLWPLLFILVPILVVGYIGYKLRDFFNRM